MKFISISQITRNGLHLKCNQGQELFPIKRRNLIWTFSETLSTDKCTKTQTPKGFIFHKISPSSSINHQNYKSITYNIILSLFYLLYNFTPSSKYNLLAIIHTSVNFYLSFLCSQCVYTYTTKFEITKKEHKETKIQFQLQNSTLFLHFYRVIRLKIKRIIIPVLM